MKYSQILIITFIILLVLWSQLSTKPSAPSSALKKMDVYSLNTQLKGFHSNLPLVVINTHKVTPSHKRYISADMSIIQANENNRTTLEDIPSYQGKITMKVRGSSSLRYPKKQYVFTTLDEEGNDQDVSLLGMPKEHRWILHAPYSDKTLMRNHLVHQKAREIDPSKYYGVRTKLVELLRVSSKGYYHYEGVYILMEKIKRDKNRIHVKKVKPSRISNGYIIQLDKDIPSNIPLMFQENRKFSYVYPDPLKITKAQKLYISTYFKEFQNALYSDDFNNTLSAKHYSNWIDEESFIVHLLVSELFMDADVWMYSEYLHKDSNQKLHLSTVWDFNLAMGNDNYHFMGDYKRFVYKQHFNGAPYTISAWIQRLMSDEAFYQKVKRKWQELRTSIWSDEAFIRFIDQTHDRLSQPAKRNYARWKWILGNFTWPNRQTCQENGKPIYCKTYKSVVENDLKKWLLKRLEWMDHNL